MADGVAGFPPAPGRKLLGARVAVRAVWRAGIGAVDALRTPDGGVAVVTANRASRTLRVWRPLDGAVALVPLDVRPRCLLGLGDAVVIGHDGGLLALSLDAGGAGSPGRGRGERT